MVEEWFEEYMTSGRGKLYRGDGFEFIIYKGFKIIKDEDGMRIVDVRKNDFYTDVQPKDFRVLHCYGFVKGADMVMYYRDSKRVAYFRDRLETRYREREALRAQKDTLDPRKYKLKLTTLDTSLRDYLDKLFFYETRKKQVEIKYKLENEQIYSVQQAGPAKVDVPSQPTDGGGGQGEEDKLHGAVPITRSRLPRNL